MIRQKTQSVASNVIRSYGSANREWDHYSAGPVLLLCQGGVRFQCLEDDADEESFEAAERFSFAFAFASFAFEVFACWCVVAGLGDRDSVESGVELSVAAAVEPVSLGAA